MNKLFAFATVIALAGPLSTGSAQPRSGEADVTEHDFADADQVEGDRATPWGDRLGARRRLPRRSLIRLRTSFTPENLKSVENL